MTAPTLSAVVVTYNSANVVATCLRSLRAELPSAEIIVVDNASSDETRLRCREFPGIMLLENSTNIGFGRASSWAREQRPPRTCCSSIRTSRCSALTRSRWRAS